MKLRRTMARALKFIQKSSFHLPSVTKRRVTETIAICEEDNDPNLVTSSTLKNAWSWIIKLHQSQINEKTLSLRQKLNMHQDGKGIWRCYGRLGKSFLPEDAKNPIFIFPNTTLAQLIIREAHGKLHRSTAHTMLEVRQKYWIPKLRQQVKKILRKCIECQKTNNLPYQYPPLAELPRRRVVRSRPFQDIGLDLFGPLRSRNTNGIRTKLYGCIFTCSTTRLLHIELISDNTTISFINALRRFMSRRGVPNSVTCDNAPTFLLAEKILTNDDDYTQPEEQLNNFMTNAGIKWIKITPYAPWKGGFYERLIKDIKLSLKRALGRRIVDEDSLRTILTKIEGCLNGRPLTYQEEDSEEISFIRPIDFVQKQITISYPMVNNNDDTEDPNFLTPREALQLRTRKQAQEALRSSMEVTECFWKLWNDAYLTSLREQHRKYLDQGRSTPKQPKEGQLVLLHDPILPRNTWRIGRITKLLPSNDEEIRQVELQLPNKHTTKRPINLLIPLELEQEEKAGHTKTMQTATPNPTVLVDHPYDIRPKRQKTQHYPYSKEEYQLNVIYQNNGGPGMCSNRARAPFDLQTVDAHSGSVL
ncbi:hypothetical protein V3C99_001376 [Haemonchus contortus]